MRTASGGHEPFEKFFKKLQLFEKSIRMMPIIILLPMMQLVNKLMMERIILFGKIMNQ